MSKIYDILLDENKIGTTRFENADVPMGVVFGKIEFCDPNIGYDFIKDYCKSNNIELADDYPEDKLISTRTIESLSVLNEKGLEIKGIGNQISGMDSDEFEITLEGISYPFYEEEFPHHVKAYESMHNAELEREIEIVQCDSIQDIPSIDKINGLSRNKTMKVVFGKEILRKRESIGNQWKKELNDFQIGIHTQNPEINIARLISDKEIVDHQEFFEKCAKDYRNLAKRLINELAQYLEIEINPDSPLDSFNFLKRREHRPEKNIIEDWRYDVHGFHCCFENIKTGQVIEVSLVNGLEFGALDPYFFSGFIKSTPDYKPLPVEIFEDYADGVRILEKMEEIGKFEKVNGIYEGRFDTVVTDRDKVEVRIYKPKIETTKDSTLKRIIRWIKK